VRTARVRNADHVNARMLIEKGGVTAGWACMFRANLPDGNEERNGANEK